MFGGALPTFQARPSGRRVPAETSSKPRGGSGLRGNGLARPQVVRRCRRNPALANNPGGFIARGQLLFLLRRVALHPAPARRVIASKPRASRSSCTSRRESGCRKFQRTVPRTTSGANCRHLHGKCMVGVEGIGTHCQTINVGLQHGFAKDLFDAHVSADINPGDLGATSSRTSSASQAHHLSNF